MDLVFRTTYVFFLILLLTHEVDPTSVGHRPYGLELDDAETKVAAVHRWLTVFP